MIDDSGQTVWVYDSRGRLGSETKTVGSDVFVAQADRSDPAQRADFPLSRLTTIAYSRKHPSPLRIHRV